MMRKIPPEGVFQTPKYFGCSYEKIPADKLLRGKATMGRVHAGLNELATCEL
jgi:hypothetical protein